MATLEARTVSITIRRDWREVYDFAQRPENFPRWASGAATLSAATAMTGLPKRPRAGSGYASPSATIWACWTIM